jgi:hypothetical protein
MQEFIMGTMAAPTVYVFMWMIIFGGAGLRSGAGYSGLEFSFAVWKITKYDEIISYFAQCSAKVKPVISNKETRR